MSRRYGRNQKRRHRKLVAMLQAAVKDSGVQLVQTRNTLKRTQQKLNDANDAMAMVMEILPRNHIALPAEHPSNMDVDLPPGEPLLVCEEEYLDERFDIDASTGTVSLQAMQTLAIMLKIRQAEDPSFRRELGGQLHFCVRMGSTGELCYAISTSAIEFLPEKQLAARLQRQIAPVLAEKLAAVLKKQAR